MKEASLQVLGMSLANLTDLFQGVTCAFLTKVTAAVIMKQKSSHACGLSSLSKMLSFSSFPVEGISPNRAMEMTPQEVRLSQTGVWNPQSLCSLYLFK